MNFIFVWLLVTVSDGSNNRGTVTYSPPLATIEDCQKIKNQVESNNLTARTYCVQVRKVIEK